MKQLSDQSRSRIPLLTCTYCSNGCYNWLFFFFLDSSNFILSFTTTCYGYSCSIQYLLYPVSNWLDLQFLIVDFVNVYFVEEFTENLVWHRNSSYCLAILICQLQLLTKTFNVKNTNFIILTVIFATASGRETSEITEL